jgi:hypothetical protein
MCLHGVRTTEKCCLGLMRIHAELVTLTSPPVKTTVICEVATGSLVEIDRRFIDAYCVHYQVALMMEAVSTSETSVNFYDTLQRYIPQYSHLYTRRCEKLKSHLLPPGLP